MRIKDIIKEKLLILKPSYLSISDVSDDHAGHAGARHGGESHFDVVIVAAQFSGVSKIARQRMIYKLLQVELANQIHALSIKVYSEEEYE